MRYDTQLRMEINGHVSWYETGLIIQRCLCTFKRRIQWQTPHETHTLNFFHAKIETSRSETAVPVIRMYWVYENVIKDICPALSEHYSLAVRCLLQYKLHIIMEEY
jgi:hypothetical protein